MKEMIMSLLACVISAISLHLAGWFKNGMTDFTQNWHKLLRKIGIGAGIGLVMWSSGLTYEQTVEKLGNEGAIAYTGGTGMWIVICESLIQGIVKKFKDNKGAQDTQAK
jgi:hypothetical protein